MSKRKFEDELIDQRTNKRSAIRENVKKHTLDSDEEDFVDEDNILDNEDIEGEEDGIARQDEGQRMTAFNMKEEMEEGHFDKDGHFIWNNEAEIKDNWLDNIDWQKIKHSETYKDKYSVDEVGLGAESDSEEETDDSFDEIQVYKDIFTLMKPKESINKAIKRLSGDNMKLSSMERLKRKKAGTLNNNEDCTKLTELANKLLSKLGNMDIYQETYEQIQTKIENSEKKGKTIVKEAEFDMYADDFSSKEQEKIHSGPSSNVTFKSPEEDPPKPKEISWEFKWKIEDEEIQGPFSTAQMIKYAEENHFKSGVMVRKCGENGNFYTSNRIDFELYE